MLIGGIFFMMLKVVNTTVLKTTLFVNFIPLQPLGLFITTLLVLQSSYFPFLISNTKYTLLQGGWWNMEKRPTLAFFFSDPCLNPPPLPPPYLPYMVCFFHIHVFSNVFWSQNIVFQHKQLTWNQLILILCYLWHFAELDLQLDLQLGHASVQLQALVVMH